MEQDFERYNIHALQDLYMTESREFANALETGVSWKQLQRLRDRIKRISALINKKFDEEYGTARNRSHPPHGD